MRTLVLLRHGESVWNSEGLFTGWVDVGLSGKGMKEAEKAGTLLREAGLAPDVVHTSVLTRAIQTANIALESAGLLKIGFNIKFGAVMLARHAAAYLGSSSSFTGMGLKSGSPRYSLRSMYARR